MNATSVQGSTPSKEPTDSVTDTTNTPADTGSSGSPPSPDTNPTSSGGTQSSGEDGEKDAIDYLLIFSEQSILWSDEVRRLLARFLSLLCNKGFLSPEEAFLVATGLEPKEHPGTVAEWKESLVKAGGQS